MRRALLLAVVGLAPLLLAPSAMAAPVITPKLFGTPGDNGWYRSNVTVNWTVTDDAGHLGKASFTGRVRGSVVVRPALNLGMVTVRRAFPGI